MSKNVKKIQYANPSTNEIIDVISEYAIKDKGGREITTLYKKPTDGVPKSDLSSAVQTSLGKADSAI